VPSNSLNLTVQLLLDVLMISRFEFKMALGVNVQIIASQDDSIIDFFPLLNFPIKYLVRAINFL